MRHQHSVRQRFRRKRPADLPAGHGESLARAAQRNRALPHARQRRNPHVRRAVVGHPLVDLIAQHQQIMLLRDLRQRQQLLAAVHLAHGVERRIDNNQFGLRADRGPQIFHIDPPVRRTGGAGPGPQGNIDRCPARHDHRRRITVVERLDQDHLIARVHQPLHRGVNPLGRARGHNDLCQRIQLTIEDRAVHRRQRIHQTRMAGAARILIVAGDQRGARRLNHKVRWGKIGETLPKINGIVFK